MKKTNAIRMLDQQNIDYDLLEYQYDPDNLSLDKIARENQLVIDQIYKTLVAKGDKTGVIIALLSGQESLDFKALAKNSGNKKITLVAVKDLLSLTGYIRGGCSPIGMKKNFPVYISSSIQGLDQLYFNAGTRGVLIKMKSQKLIRLCNAKVANIGKLIT